MEIMPGKTVMLTGASGGLGRYMSAEFAAAGSKLALVAFPGVGLDEVRQAVTAQGAEAHAFTCDLRDEVERHRLINEVEQTMGPIDILVNNAGVEYTAYYHQLSEAQIRQVLNVNLEVPMVLSRMVLPGMLSRRRGHIVNISSLAGKSGPAFQEPYAATKAALVAFTASLRATYQGTGVSASVVVPGFVEAGIYAKLQARTGRKAPLLLGTCSPRKVAQAVLKAVRRDRLEILVNRMPVRPVLMLSALSPSLGEWVTNRIGTREFFAAALSGDPPG
jgi:short-subunit dehydrogenase